MLASVLGGCTQFFLDSEELVVLGQSLRPAGSASFNLTSAKADHKISDEGVFGLSAPVRYHHSPAYKGTPQPPQPPPPPLENHRTEEEPHRQRACGLRDQASLYGFCDGTDLVDFQQKSIAGLLLLGHFNALRVGDQQIVAHNLHLLDGQAAE